MLKFMSKIIRKVFTVERGDVLKNQAHHSDEVGKATNSIASIYEVNPSEADNRKRLKKSVELFDKLFAEMHDSIWDTCFSEEERRSYMYKIEDIRSNAGNIKKEMLATNSIDGEVI